MTLQRAIALLAHTASLYSEGDASLSLHARAISLGVRKGFAWMRILIAME